MTKTPEDCRERAHALLDEMQAPLDRIEDAEQEDVDEPWTERNPDWWRG